MKTSLAFLASLVAPVLGQTWYYVHLGTPSGVNITGFSGVMEVPTTFPSGYPNSGGTYYMWPGLVGVQGGVLQNVLGPNKDGSTWGVYSGFCCQDGIPWGGGIESMNGGTEVWFYNHWNDDGSWTAETAINGQAPAAINNFPLQGHTFNSAYFAIELYSPAAWNFGPLYFTNIDIWWIGSDTSNCNNNLAPNGNFQYSISGATASLENGQVHCHFDSITLSSPNSS